MKLRYLACGEYGETYGRPHYHAVFFGQDFLVNTDQVGPNRWKSGWLEDIWQKGMVEVSTLTPELCFYTAGYVEKKAGDEDTFSSKSKNLGKRYAEEFASEIVANGGIVINGRPSGVPRIFFEWFPEKYAPLKRERTQYAIEKGYLETLEEVHQRVKIHHNKQLNKPINHRAF